jgi:hypothetical protein
MDPLTRRPCGWIDRDTCRVHVETTAGELGCYSRAARHRCALLLTRRGAPIMHAYRWEEQTVVAEVFVRLSVEQARQWFNVCGSPVPAELTRRAESEAAAPVETAGMETPPEARTVAARFAMEAGSMVALAVATPAVSQRGATAAASSGPAGVPSARYAMHGESTAAVAAPAPAVLASAASATPAETAGTLPEQEAAPVAVELLSVSTMLPAGLVSVGQEETP